MLKIFDFFQFQRDAVYCTSSLRRTTQPQACDDDDDDDAVRLDISSSTENNLAFKCRPDIYLHSSYYLQALASATYS